jgi:hypothetical protein
LAGLLLLFARWLLLLLEGGCLCCGGRLWLCCLLCSLSRKKSPKKDPDPDDKLIVASGSVLGRGLELVTQSRESSDAAAAAMRCAWNGQPPEAADFAVSAACAKGTMPEGPWNSWKEASY